MRILANIRLSGMKNLSATFILLLMITTMLPIAAVAQNGKKSKTQSSITQNNNLKNNNMEKKKVTAGRDILFGKGTPNTAYAKYFIGDSWLEPMVSPTKEVPISAANVTFEPRCRNNWHIHNTVQILLITKGRGWYQEEGKAAQPLKEGDIVVIQPNIKHWHGAACDSWFTHISISAVKPDSKTEWLEPVQDTEYDKL